MAAVCSLGWMNKMTETIFLWLWGPSALGFVVVAVFLINKFDLPRPRHKRHPAE
jgi:hypothetical protein